MGISFGNPKNPYDAKLKHLPTTSKQTLSKKHRDKFFKTSFVKMVQLLGIKMNLVDRIPTKETWKDNKKTIKIHKNKTTSPKRNT